MSKFSMLYYVVVNNEDHVEYSFDTHDEARAKLCEFLCQSIDAYMYPTKA